MSPTRQRIAWKFIREHLMHTPLVRIPGKIKELHGKYRGRLQFNIDQLYRLIYWVDKVERVVYVQYIGPHL